MSRSPLPNRLPPFPGNDSANLAALLASPKTLHTMTGTISRRSITHAGKVGRLSTSFTAPFDLLLLRRHAGPIIGSPVVLTVFCSAET